MKHVHKIFYPLLRAKIVSNLLWADTTVETAWKVSQEQGTKQKKRAVVVHVPHVIFVNVFYLLTVGWKWTGTVWLMEIPHCRPVSQRSAPALTSTCILTCFNIMFSTGWTEKKPLLYYFVKKKKKHLSSLVSLKSMRFMYNY